MDNNRLPNERITPIEIFMDRNCGLHLNEARVSMIFWKELLICLLEMAKFSNPMCHKVIALFQRWSLSKCHNMATWLRNIGPKVGPSKHPHDGHESPMSWFWKIVQHIQLKKLPSRTYPYFNWLFSMLMKNPIIAWLKKFVWPLIT